MGKEAHRDDDNDHADDLVRRGFWRKVPGTTRFARPPQPEASPSKDKDMTKKRPLPAKDVKLTPPPEAQEKLAPGERAALREAALELQLARQRVQLLVSEHGHAMAAAQAAEQKYQQASEAVVARYKIGPDDKVNINTGEISRAAEATG